MSAFDLYGSLEGYLSSRIKDLGHSMASLAEALGFSHAYVSGIARGHFKPSEKRCLKIAQYFNDDPHVILELAGFYVPEKKGPSQDHVALQAILGILPRSHLQEVLNFARFRKWLLDQERMGIEQEESKE